MIGRRNISIKTHNEQSRQVLRCVQHGAARIARGKIAVAKAMDDTRPSDEHQWRRVTGQSLRLRDKNSLTERGNLKAEITAYLNAGIDGFFTDDSSVGREAVDSFLLKK